MLTVYSATVTLILVMDPLGNIPVFLSILNNYDAKKRNRIILREAFIAYVILTLFLFTGRYILHGLNITEPALGIAGGIILFLIAIKMIFPPEKGAGERQIGEPFIVPLAIPLIAGPSALATVLLFSNRGYLSMGYLFVSLTIALLFCLGVLLLCNTLRKLLGQKGLIAIERLMGMVLTTVAVQMFLSGLSEYFKLS